MKIYRRLLASYLAVCLVPLLLSMFTIVKLERSVQESIIQDREQAIRTTQYDVDKNLNDAASAVGIMVEETLIADLGEKYSLTEQDVFDLCKVVDVLSVPVRQQTAFYSSFCYLFRSNYLASNARTYHPQVLDIYVNSLGVDQEEFFSILDNNHISGAVCTIYKKDGTGYIMVLQNVYDSWYKEKLCCVGILIRADASLLSWSGEDSEVFLIDEQGRLLYGGENAQTVCEQAERETVSNQPIVLDGEKYLYSIYPFSQSNIQYGFLTMEKAYYESVRTMRWNMAMEIIVCFAVGILTAVFLSRRTWSPFEGVLLFMNKTSSGGGGEKESEFPSMKSFADALKGFAEEKETLENRLQQSRERARSGYIARYLLGIDDDSSILSQYIEEGQPYRLLLFLMIKPEESDFFAGVSSNKYTETMETFYFAVRNILEEVFLGKRGGVSLEIENSMVILVQDPPDEEEIRQAVAMTEQALRVPIACYVGDVCMQIADAPNAWEWVQRAYRNDTFWQNGQQPGVRFVSDVLQNTNYKSYGDFLDRQKKLAGFLSGKNHGKARKCLENILEEDLSDQNLPFEMVRYRYWGVAELILSYMPEDKYGEISKEIPHHGTVGQMKQELLDLFEQIQLESGPEVADDKNYQWAQEVQLYIHENYRDPALNASMIADHLHISLSSLSRRYKNTVGRGVLDELHMVRLEAAKKLLENGVSVRETAEQTGYIESRAMIRAFKRYEGVTPGQYADRK